MKRKLSALLAMLTVGALILMSGHAAMAAGLPGADDNAAAAHAVGTVSSDRHTARISADNGLRLRRSMSTETDNVIAVIPKGKIVVIKSREKNNWFRVNYNGTFGYVKGGYLEDNPNRMRTTGELNLRTQMNTGDNNNIITEMPKGSVVEVISAQKDNWYLVNYKGKNGYAKGGYLEKISGSGKTIDLKGVTFKDITVPYDGKEHKLPKVANLPEGVKVTYSSTSTYKSIGEHTVTATFSPLNGNTLVHAEPLKASLIITVKKGSGYIVKGIKYKVTNANLKGKGTLSVYGAKSKTVSKVTIPDKVKIGSATFKVTSVTKNAFKGFSKLKEVKVGAKVTSIGDGAFMNCKKLKSLSIGKGIKTLGKQVFQGDSKLAKITIKSKKLTKVGKNALKDINEFAIIEVPSSKVKAYTKLFKNKGQGDLVTVQQ